MSHLTYHQYLLQRSWLGHNYRKYWLYPKLSRALTGLALDFGCGIGDFLRFRNSTVGVDINPYNINYCKDLGLEVSLIEKNQLPYDESSFDSVLMDNVLEHIPTPGPSILEIHRVLKKGGDLLVGVPGSRGFASDTDHKIMYRLNDLTDLAEKYGFKYSSHFFTPFNMKLLDDLSTKHCLYASFTKI